MQMNPDKEYMQEIDEFLVILRLMESKLLNQEFEVFSHHLLESKQVSWLMGSSNMLTIHKEGFEPSPRMLVFECIEVC